MKECSTRASEFRTIEHVMENTRENEYLTQIMEILRKLNIRKVILFGSYALGKTHEDSDIDLLIVLDESFIPNDYDEWLKLKVQIRKALREVNNEVPIDLLVYTKPQYEMLRANMNSFQKEIHETGKVLYEKAG